MNPKHPELELIRELPSTSGRIVWEAIQKPLGRRIAYLRLAEGVLPSSPRARALLDEARAHARLSHPNIALVHSISVTATDVAVEAELAQGEDLVSYVTLHPSEMVGLLTQVASSLAHAHERGVLHGGLESQSVQVMDGGVAKVHGFRFIVPDSRSIVPDDAGSGVALLCPEVQKGGLYSTLSDVYLFGALAYRVITGSDWTRESRSLGSSMIRTLRSEPGLPRGLPELIDRCLARIPADRPAEMTEVVRELEVLVIPRKAVDGEERMRFQGVFLRVLIALGILCAVGLVLLALRSRKPAQQTLSRVPLESSVSQKARLRIVARPWARVFIDGDYQDTTPFASLLTVSPGQHSVRLEHPNAPPEERLVEVQNGQVAIVDVEMKILRSPLPRGESIPFVENTP